GQDQCGGPILPGSIRCRHVQRGTALKTCRQLHGEGGRFLRVQVHPCGKESFNRVRVSRSFLYEGESSSRIARCERLDQPGTCCLLRDTGWKLLDPFLGLRSVICAAAFDHVCHCRRTVIRLELLRV